MALTLNEALAQWKAANPQLDGESAEDYDARATDMAGLMVAMSEREDAEAARTALRRKYRAARNILDNPIGTTQAQVRQNVIEHRNILSGLLEVLKDAQIVLDD